MEVTDPERESNPSIEAISAVWEDSLSAANMDMLNRRGHLPDTSRQPDPFGQFAWLDKILAELQSAGKFAYIAGHIAPIVDSYGGNPQWHTKYIARYKEIVGKYSDVIKAQFFGHVHSVEFRVPVPSLDREDNAFQLLPMYITGSISPLFGNNPSFMVWDYDTGTYEILDYTVYASYIAETDPQLDWKLLFKASDAYGLKSLSLTELSAFVQRVEHNVSLVEEYYWNMKARSPNARPCKDIVCHAKTLCTLKWWTTKGEFLACVDTVQTMATARVYENDQTPTSPVQAVATASSGSSSSQNDLRSKDVYMTIAATAIATIVAVLCVAVTFQVLRRTGILKNRAQYDTVATL
ncbi:unnamed protein product [Phytophthora fragariaefolia]|uniref:Unnamed protein product n=1 Tax=Phytophthora fragariaefolia TaxID=1490495 RepID=A0A9W6WPP2_9STRA|nr:unnamed protein product [Phytophthora fragariaefolia]